MGLVRGGGEGKDLLVRPRLVAGARDSSADEASALRMTVLRSGGKAALRPRARTARDKVGEGR
jgi:hypothetical protein